jgi:alpha-beta hydrolase superfamily lysophospholipase
MLCRPRDAGRSLAVIIGNTAADPRAGVGGFATYAARALAMAGVTTLRFDFRGVGESADTPDGRVHVYETSRLDDYKQAAEFLDGEGFTDPVLLGVCTGGYHAVRAVIEPSPFRRAIAINSWLVWRPGRELELRAEAAQGAAKPTAPRAPARSRIERLLRGELNVTQAVKRRLTRTWSSRWPDAACRAVRGELRRARRDAIDIHVLLGRGDRAMIGLEQDFGVGCRWLRAQPGVAVEIIPDLDHALFSHDSQRKALQEIFRMLRLAPAAPASAAVAVAKRPTASPR